MRDYSKQNKKAWENDNLPGEFTIVATKPP